MLGSKDALATIAVKDLKAASGFYENTLGLKVAWFKDSDGNILSLISG